MKNFDEILSKVINKIIFDLEKIKKIFNKQKRDFGHIIFKNLKKRIC